MKRWLISLTVLVLCVSPVFADPETSKILAEAAKRSQGALVVVQYKVKQPGATNRPVSVFGQAICIDAANGVSYGCK